MVKRKRMKRKTYSKTEYNKMNKRWGRLVKKVEKLGDRQYALGYRQGVRVESPNKEYLKNIPTSERKMTNRAWKKGY